MRLCSFSLFVRLLEQKKVTFLIRFPKLSSLKFHMNFLQMPAFNDRCVSYAFMANLCPSQESILSSTPCIGTPMRPCLHPRCKESQRIVDTSQAVIPSKSNCTYPRRKAVSFEKQRAMMDDNNGDEDKYSLASMTERRYGEKL